MIVVGKRGNRGESATMYGWEEEWVELDRIPG